MAVPWDRNEYKPKSIKWCSFVGIVFNIVLFFDQNWPLGSVRAIRYKSLPWRNIRGDSKISGFDCNQTNDLYQFPIIRQLIFFKGHTFSNNEFLYYTNVTFIIFHSIPHIVFDEHSWVFEINYMKFSRVGEH